MSTGPPPKPPPSGDGVKSDAVAAPTPTHVRPAAPTSAAGPTSMPPTSTSVGMSLPPPRAIVSASAQLRPALATIHRPILQDVVKSIFTPGPAATRPPFMGSGRLLAPAIPATSSSASGVSPFSSSAIGLSTSSTSTLQPIISKPAVATQPGSVIGPAATASAASSMGVTTATTTAVAVAAAASAPMASIIRGVTHAHPAMQAAYSSHVPRGAAAVASITTLKSAVATPIQRTSQLYPQGFSSATAGGHLSVQSRPSTLPMIRAGPPPPISRTISSAFSSSDLHRPQTLAGAVSTTLPAGKLLIAAPRTAADGNIRQTIHSSSGALPKSQTFLHQLHQLPEKGFYRPSYAPATLLSSQVPTTTPVKVTTVGHQGLPSSTAHLMPPQSQLATHSAAAASSTVSIAVTASAAGSSFVTTAPPQSTHAQYHPHLPKVIAQAVHTIAPISQMLPTVGVAPSSSAKAAVTTSVVVTHSLPRPIVSTGTSIPVAKVYPQPLTVATRPVVTEFAQHVQQQQQSSSAPTATLFISPSQQRSSLSAVANMASPVMAGNVMSAGVVIAESKADRPTVQNTTTFATIPPGTTTYYYEPYHGLPGTAALTMHPFPGTTGTHPFAAVSTATLRAGLPMHGTPVRGAASNSAPVNIGSAVIMSMSPNNRQPLGIASTIGQTNVLVSDSFVSSSSSTSGSNTSGTITSLGSLVGHLMPSIPGSPVHSAANSGQAVTPSSSPRPSILRKRTIDSTNMSVRKNLMSSLPGSQPPSPQQRDSVAGAAATAAGTPSSSTSSSPKSIIGGAKDGSQENAPSSEGNDSSCNGNNASRVIVKREPMDAFDALNGKTASSTILTGAEASPRKKPRKQQFTGNEMVELHSTEGEEDFEKDNRNNSSSSNNNLKKDVVKEDDESVRWFSTRKRPPVAAMLNTYRHSWKSRNNHFLRYSDIKLKDERRPTIGDLANQKGVIQKASGWKIYHVCAQIEDLTELETACHSRLTDLLENMEKKAGTKESDDVDLNRANELVRGNLQRCKIIRDQMKDARQQILKVLDHKSRIVDIVTKYVSKPTGRKRDRNY